MEQELQFIGNYGILGLLLYFSIKEFFNWLGKSKSNGKDSEIALLKAEVAELKAKLNKIETNDLFHLKIQLEGIDKQNTIEHREIKDILIRIENKKFCSGLAE
jgi:hypothetical protein